VAGSERLERILDEDYLADLAARPTSEIRAMRDECEEEENGVSYARRILQGKLDIVRAEALRRREEVGAGDRLDELMEALPGILSDRPTARRPAARAVRFLVPPSAQHHADRAEALGERTLAALGERSEEELTELVRDLDEEERRLSALRRELFERIDALQDELARRYKAGATDVSEVLPRDG
jgi:hypothetical protein